MATLSEKTVTTTWTLMTSVKSHFQRLSGEVIFIKYDSSTPTTMSGASALRDWSIQFFSTPKTGENIYARTLSGTAALSVTELE